MNILLRLSGIKTVKETKLKQIRNIFEAMEGVFQLVIFREGFHEDAE